MFRGSLPGDMQRIIKQHVSDWDSPDVFIGCSGNLTIERVLADTGRRLHGNDILLYSAAIGSYLAGTPTRYRVSDYGLQEFPWLTRRFDSEEERLATVLIMSRLAMAAGKTNAYYDRMRRAHEAQWDSLVDKTVKRIETCGVSLASFAAEDVQTWIDRVPNDAGVISYPPFYAGDYESQFRKLESLFVWDDAPDFVPLDAEKVEALFGKIADRANWMLGVNREIPSLADHLKAVAQTTNRGIPIFVYGNRGRPRLVQPRQPSDALLVPHLQAGDDIGTRLSLTVLSEPQFSSLRSLYMNPHIKPGAASLPVGVLADGRLVGVFAFSFAPTMANWDSYLPGPHVYLLSDFPVANTSYKHLAKLVLYAALSKEAKALAERSANRRYNALTTTAFSARPASMKYRGVLRLLSRKEKENYTTPGHVDSSEAYYAQRYELQYGAPLGQWSLAEALETWQTKHGATT
jgi:hypothetical protein